jgi:DNA-binding response OmpR family regulator
MGLEPPRLLIVDDDKYLLPVLLRMAKILHYDAHGVLSPVDALAYLAATHADLVVTDATLERGLVVADVLMPGVDGCTLGREIVRRWPGTRMLFISGYVSWKLRELGICPQLMPLLQKPFVPSEFKACVEAILASPPWDPEDPMGERWLAWDS